MIMSPIVLFSSSSSSSSSPYSEGRNLMNILSQCSKCLPCLSYISFHLPSCDMAAHRLVFVCGGHSYRCTCTDEAEEERKRTPCQSHKEICSLEMIKFSCVHVCAHAYLYVNSKLFDERLMTFCLVFSFFIVTRGVSFSSFFLSLSPFFCPVVLINESVVWSTNCRRSSSSSSCLCLFICH